MNRRGNSIGSERCEAAERTRIAFQRGTPDRVPIGCWVELPIIEKLRPPEKSFLDLFEDSIEDPVGSIVKMQQDLGLDPMITAYSQHIGEHEIWPRMCFLGRSRRRLDQDL